MQTNPTPLAIALAIVLSAPSFFVAHAVPHGLNQRSATIESRQGAAELSAHLPHLPIEGGWPTSASDTTSAAAGATATAAATVTSIKTVTVVPTQTLMPIRRPNAQGGTMKPISQTTTSPSNSSPISLPTPTTSTSLLLDTIEIFPSSSIVITIPNWSTIVVPTPVISIVNPLQSSTTTPSSSPTPTPSTSESEQDTSSSTSNTCPTNAVKKCCTSLNQVSNSLLNIVNDILPILDLDNIIGDSLDNIIGDALDSSTTGLSCTDLAEDGVCESVPSCCIEETILGFDSDYISCVPLL